MKSRSSNIRDESRKPAVYHLCEGLMVNPYIRTLHRQCHYIMWGEEVAASRQVETRFSVYEDSVCRPCVMKNSHVLVEPAQIIVAPGNSLAQGAAAGTAGLTKPHFFHYLSWLLGDRNGPDPSFSQTAQLPITLIGNSAERRIFGKTFNTYADFDTWANQALQNKASRGGN
ncbi:hypothetical protein PB70LOC_00433 [Pectobacterium versatile]|nr:hypothetical protein PB70LOC_00433 [Pectobacterium versatile]POY64577.1 hypothetical protein PB69LOC_00842 [Pectobacterium versatile]